MKTTIIILAGGKSSRMGQDKGLMLFNGQALVEHIIGIAKQLSNKIIIISNQKKYNKFGIPVFEDIYKEKGPVGGIHSGLYYSKTENNLVVGCDMPYLSSKLLNHLLINIKPGFDAIVPRFNNLPEPLCAVYFKSCTKKLEECIESGQLKMMDIIRLWNTNYVDITSDLNFFSTYLFTNLNTQQELEILQKSIK